MPLKVAEQECWLWGGGFIGNLGRPWLYRGEETGLAELPCQLKGRQRAGRGHGQTEP